MFTTGGQFLTVDLKSITCLMLTNSRIKISGRRTILVWLLALLFSVGQGMVGSAALAQSQSAKGTVVSASDGMPLPGVSVLIKGTTIGTVTDFDGNYNLSVDNGQTLVFSFLGFKNQEIVFAGAPINVSLEEETTDLEDVVVVGYGVQKKKLVTGATVQVKGDDVQKLNTNNALQALQGQTPGVNIQSTSGQPGSAMNVSIRGLGTVGNSTLLTASVATSPPSTLPTLRASTCLRMLRRPPSMVRRPPTASSSSPPRAARKAKASSPMTDITASSAYIAATRFSTCAST